MPHNLRRAFVTEHHSDISVFPQRCFQSYSTISIGPFFVEMVEVTTRHSGYQQQHLMWRWTWVFPVFQWTEPARVAVLRKPHNLRSLGKVSKSLQLGAQVLLRNVLPVMLNINGSHGGASLGFRNFPGFSFFTWFRRTAAPEVGWPRSRVFWRCRSSRCMSAGGDWASPLAAASPDGAPRSGLSARSSPFPDAPIPGQRQSISTYYWKNTS